MSQILLGFASISITATHTAPGQEEVDWFWFWMYMKKKVLCIWQVWKLLCHVFTIHNLKPSWNIIFLSQSHKTSPTFCQQQSQELVCIVFNFVSMGLLSTLLCLSLNILHLSDNTTPKAVWNRALIIKWPSDSSYLEYLSEVCIGAKADTTQSLKASMSNWVYLNKKAPLWLYVLCFYYVGK